MTLVIIRAAGPVVERLSHLDGGFGARIAVTALGVAQQSKIRAQGAAATILGVPTVADVDRIARRVRQDSMRLEQLEERAALLDHGRTA